MTAVSVIIPNYNGAELLPGCLAALRGQGFADFEVILVDNGSTDNSVDLALEIYPALNVVRLKVNEGFAAACNAGFKESNGSWIAVLNSDAEPEPGWLAWLVCAAQSADDVGMVASRVLRYDKRDVVDSLGIMMARNGLVYLRGIGEPDRADQALPEVEEIFGPSGVAALYRRAMLERIGFFEPDFFAYYEDADLALCARWSGWRCLLAHRARVAHRHSATADRIKLDKTYYLHRNRWRTIFRGWPGRSIIRNLGWIAVYDLLILLYTTYRERRITALKARADGLRFFFEDCKWRRARANQRTAGSREIDRWISKKHPGLMETFRRKRNDEKFRE